ncbi:GINS complex subunit [Maudiozyma exigua]|uniref:DNA replication complex GINS protein SLD5 n=1 Tax=Maudiozyma exigua TaxID=34358 RepID=A0A9P6VVS9_MAUEX|nr:GINS complex subunit [Kazachstania exigua]
MDVDIEDILAELNTDSTAVDQSGNPFSDINNNNNASTLYNESSSYPETNLKTNATSTSIPSPQQDYNNLIILWRNERCAPELLPYPHNLMTRMLSRIQEQMERLEIISMDFLGQQHSTTTTDTTGNNPVNNNNMLPLLCMEAELERIKFVIRSFIRCRLSKIDKFSLYLRQINEENESISPLQDFLSKDEMIYYESHSEILLKLFNDTILKHLPPNMQAINDNTGTVPMIDEPDWNKFVFIKVIGPQNKIFNTDPILIKGDNGKWYYEVIIPELQERVELIIDSIYVMRYKVIKDLLMEGKVTLI